MWNIQWHTDSLLRGGGAFVNLIRNKNDDTCSDIYDTVWRNMKKSFPVESAAGGDDDFRGNGSEDALFVPKHDDVKERVTPPLCLPGSQRCFPCEATNSSPSLICEVKFL